MATMKQIARMANVSLGTVSNVLNNSAQVREPLRSRVMEAVKALGYQPSELARGLRLDKTNTIGMIIPDLTNPFFPAIVRGAEDIAFSNGYRLMLCHTDNDHTKELAYLTSLRAYMPAGLIVIPSSFSDLTVHAESYRKSGSAVICVDRLPRDWKGDSVTVDNEQGGYSAAQLLLRMGHKQMAVIAGPLHLTNSQERVNGFKRALKEARLNLAPDFIQETTFEQQGGYSKGLLLLRMLPRPTAIFATNDMIALGVLAAVQEMGMRCPGDVSVIGFDNLSFVELTCPPLTSIHQSGYQLGTTAARILLDRVTGDESPARHCVLPTEIRVRGSVAPPPAPQDTLTPVRHSARASKRSEPVR